MESIGEPHLKKQGRLFSKSAKSHAEIIRQLKPEVYISLTNYSRRSFRVPDETADV